MQVLSLEINAMESARTRLLDLVKRQGPVTADDLAARLGVTAMAVRQHLYGLVEDGLVTHVEEARGVGRPVKLWRATSAANAQFADSHAALAFDRLAQFK